MSRPRKCRFVERFPASTFFKPSGIMMRNLEKNIISHDELESLRLADLEAMFHEDAAMQMGISRATFGRIVEKARYIVADALINGKALVIEGGDFCSDFILNEQKNKITSRNFISSRRDKCKNCPKLARIDINPQEEGIKVI
ncbi:MAG: hypothetical protein A2X61_16890 [Ignavibacteria bacterium GWB2_35_12]|nr:MAG: hypothetical protein A2X63_02010 [Ignavibacteria bacterium GWA2_35_8]OGU38027.1 MAG: hypothetical protein A2X61_16890 [Ignavibacteria bacterium GWB2_35_12]OGU89109.1 MAG: hypothetical protein A2220_15405 [Ignavibacteria bacterium RIFOXYA2_FULL_35_10]OGV25051.1 MAG: hypothetical protein A2475_16735 [Ignavibacteria bacterium RIFOXYC2_FULL_35_21]